MENEIVVLSSLLVNPEYSIPIIKQMKIIPLMFTQAKNRAIFEAIMALDGDGVVVNVVSVVNTLKNKAIKFEDILDLSDRIDYAWLRTACQYLIEEYYAREIKKADKERAIDLLHEFEDITVENTLQKPIALKELMNETMDGLEKIQGTQPVYVTGIKKVDFHLGEFQEGVTIIGGQTGKGKTAFALTTALNLGKKGIKTLIWSLEMSEIPLAKRFITMESGIPLFPPYDRNIKEWSKVMDGASKLADLPIKIYAQNCDTATAFPVIRKEKTQFLIIDYLQFVESDGETRNIAVGKVSKQISALAKELHIPILLLSQLTRLREDKTPELKDLRDSGTIEQDANCVMFVYEEKIKNVIKNIIKIAKNRNGSANFEIEVLFDKPKMRFVDITREYE
jgi:replicative DNA helicase